MAANEIIVKKYRRMFAACNADPEREQPGATPAEHADL
jgi:hypothetical protein